MCCSSMQLSRMGHGKKSLMAFIAVLVKSEAVCAGYAGPRGSRTETLKGVVYCPSALSRCLPERHTTKFPA